MKNRVLKEIKEIQAYIEDRTDEIIHTNNDDEREDLFDKIRKYSNYKIALEQVINDFPIEIGSY